LSYNRSTMDIEYEANRGRAIMELEEVSHDATFILATSERSFSQPLKDLQVLYQNFGLSTFTTHAMVPQRLAPYTRISHVNTPSEPTKTTFTYLISPSSAQKQFNTSSPLSKLTESKRRRFKRAMRNLGISPRVHLLQALLMKQAPVPCLGEKADQFVYEKYYAKKNEYDILVKGEFHGLTPSDAPEDRSHLLLFANIVLDVEMSEWPKLLPLYSFDIDPK
jgi:hypothetical protein